MKVDGKRQARDSNRYVSLVKGNFPFDCLPDGFGDNLTYIRNSQSTQMFPNVQDARSRMYWTTCGSLL